jgi:hypothetical protein
MPGCCAPTAATTGKQRKKAAKRAAFLPTNHRSEQLAVRAAAAALPSALTVIRILILAIRGTARLLTTALTTTLTALTTLLTALLLAVALSGIARVRASHDILQCMKVTIDSGKLLFECRRG